MLPAVLTTLFFATSAVYGQRTAMHFGSIRGNFWRLVLAACFLGALTAALDPSSFSRPTFAWLFFSGLIGFGLGDLGLFLAFPRLGSRLSVLINLCLAPIWGALVEFLWLGTRITGVEAAATVIILVGVGMALAPGRTQRFAHAHDRGGLSAGIALAALAGFGQGVGAVISRHAEFVSKSGPVHLDIGGISQAFQRVLGGLIVAGLAYLIYRHRRKSSSRSMPSLPTASRLQMSHWLLGSALAGPVIGVSCFQWALKSTPSALALAIVATTPIVIIPMAWLIEGDRPTLKSLAGAVIAVSGVAWICLIRTG